MSAVSSSSVRFNADAASQVGRWTLPTFVVLVAFSVWAQPTGSSAYTAGRVLGVTLLPAIVVLVAARASGTPWKTWWYGLGALFSAIYVLTTIVVPGRLALADAAQARDDQARHLSAPDSFGSWHRFTGAASSQRADQIGQQFAQIAHGPGADRTVYAEYRSSEVSAVLTGVNSTAADDLGRQLGEDPKGAVLSLMAGLGSLDPVERDAGALGGAMLCAEGYEQAQLAHCAWGDAITVAVVFFDPGVDVDEAADLTSEIREGVTVLD